MSAYLSQYLIESEIIRVEKIINYSEKINAKDLAFYDGILTELFFLRTRLERLEREKLERELI